MSVRAVVAGQLATFEVAEGTGWIRRPVPGDGILVETETTTLWVSVEDCRRCLREIRAYHAGVDPEAERRVDALVAKHAPKPGAKRSLGRPAKQGLPSLPTFRPDT